jgi:OmpA-OmpF porin, OOP family
MKRVCAAGTMKLLAFAVLTAITCPPAMAEVSNWYGGVSAGQSRAKIDDARIIAGLLAGRFATTSMVDNDRDTGYKIFGGYQINRHFAFEAGYFDMGKFGYIANTLPLGSLTGEIKIRGLNLDLVGSLPISERFSLLGRVGLSHAEARDTFTGTGLVHVVKPHVSKRDDGVKYGVGLQYAFNESWAMRVEAERHRVNDAVGNRGDVDLVSAGLIYRFGRKPATRLAYVPAPMPVVMEITRPVAPEPVPIFSARSATPTVAAPLPQPRRVTFSADSLFDFDKAIIKPAGKLSLDKFAADLRGTQFDVISVTGHTDRIGSTAYNQLLSQRRAEAVKSYLVDPAGIASARIAARGEGEAQPITKADECRGGKASPALIACLQPDRRVEVEVTGTK